MYNVFDVACYIINNYREIDKFNFISYPRLRLLLYFVQCSFIIKNDEPCFEDKMLAWPFGPTIKAIHNEFKYYGDLPIGTTTKLDTDPSYRYKEDTISEKDKRHINAVLRTFIGMHSDDMLKLIYNQTPFIDAYDKFKNAKTPTEKDKAEITIESIKDFFSNDGEKK